MPGPPPPSKSYHLKIIDSSDEEEDDDDDDGYYDHANTNTTAVSMANNSNDDAFRMPDDTPTTAAAAVRHQEKRPDSVNSNSSNEAPPKKKKKKRAKKNRKPKTSRQLQKTDSRNTATTTATSTTGSSDNENESLEEDANNKETKEVRFHKVMIREFERCLGTDVVPYDGGWPLGLSYEPVATAEDDEDGKNNNNHDDGVDLDDYEAAKQERLRIRAHERGLNLEELTKSASSSSARRVGEDETAGVVELETRQYDYKRKAKNPLFHLLTEDQRMAILLQASTPEEDGDDDSMEHSSHHSTLSSSPPKHHNHHHKGSSSKGSSPSSKKRDSKSKQNHPNSGHHTNHALHHSGHHVNTRSNSKRERSGSFSEQYNETYTQVNVHHVRNELEEIRFQRTGEGHTGCTCRKLDVYLLPPGGGGKKASKRRLSILRVKEELRKRHLLPTEQKTREELELILHDVVETEACCVGQDCPCARNGIECQADVCTCWYDSHQTKDGGKQHANPKFHNISEVSEIQERCGNANGMYVVDLNKIHHMRQQILEQCSSSSNKVEYFVCPPISPHTPPPLVDAAMMMMDTIHSNMMKHPAGGEESTVITVE